MDFYCPTIKIKKNYPDAQLPVRAYKTDSGLDVFVHNINGMINQWIYPNERIFVDTGISATVGEGYEIQVRPRSGNAIKKGLAVLNSPGTIDESFMGHICVILINLSDEEQLIEKGDKIAQLVVAPVILSEVVEVESLDETERGSGGFGSTGN
jgi:dUTP pyrophosphatase